MRRVSTIGLSLIAVMVLLMTLNVTSAQRPDAGRGDAQQDQAPQDRGPQDRGPQGGFHLMPRFAVEKMELTEEQQDQIRQLEESVRTKLEEILTPEQLKILQEARPPRRNGPEGAGPDGGANDRPQNGQRRPPREQN